MSERNDKTYVKKPIIEEVPLTYDRIKELTSTYDKFKEYLGKRGSEEDYDLQSFYNDHFTYGLERQTPYELWLETESKEPGYGHMIGKYKKPWHITYEGKNGELWEKSNEGWIYHVPEGHKDKNGKEYTLEDYEQYFSDPEGQRSFYIYKGQKYKGKPLDKKEKGGVMEIVIEKEEKKEDPLGCLLCQIMNSLGLRHHAISETKPEKLSDIFGGNAQIIIEIKGEDKAEDSFEELIKDIIPIISTTKKYTKEDIAELRKNKEGQKDSMKRLLTLMNDGNILKAFNGMQLFKNGGNIEVNAEGGQIKQMSTVTCKIGDKEYTLFEAKTDKEKEKGLMNVEDLKETEGMIFYYDSPQDVSFWMKNTSVPLDICFFNENEECISVKSGHPFNENEITEENVSFVIEVPAGSNIKPGDEIDFPGDDKEYVMQVLGSDGQIQYQLKGGERIFSRKNSVMLIKWAKRAYKSKEESHYKKLGKLVFKYLDIQDSNTPEFVHLDSKE